MALKEAGNCLSDLRVCERTRRHFELVPIGAGCGVDTVTMVH